MSLINLDSFQHYIDVTQKYSSDSTAVITAGAGRHGLVGISTDSATFFRDELVLFGQELRLGTVIHGIAFQLQSLPLAEVVLFQYLESDDTIQVTITITTDGHIKAYKGDLGATLLDTSADPIETAIYYYIESKVFIDDTVGTVEVRLWTNSAVMDTPIDFTGDTKNGGTGVVSKISYGVDGSSPIANWCSKYTCDTATSTFNDFQGNKDINAKLPNAAGSLATWLPSPDEANYLNVNSSPPDAGKFNYAPNPDLFETVERVYLEMLTPTGGSGVFTPGVGTLQNGDRLIFWMVGVGDSSGSLPDTTLTWVGTPPSPEAGPFVCYNFSGEGGTFGPGAGSIGDGPPPSSFAFTYTGDDPVCVLMAYRGVDLDNPLDGGLGVTEQIDGFCGNLATQMNNAATTSFANEVAFLMSGRGGNAGAVFQPISAAGTVAFAAGFSQIAIANNEIAELAIAEGVIVTPGAHPYEPSDTWTPEQCRKGNFLYGFRPAAIPASTSDLFAIENTTPATVDAVVVNLLASFDDTDHVVGAATKLATDIDESYGVAPGATLHFQQSPLETAPDGGAWTRSKFNAIQSGYLIDADPPPTPTLTVASLSPNSGVSITVSPDDNNSDGDGTTQFTREYNLDTTVTLTAPATATGNPFAKWKLDGVDYALVETASLSMDTDHSMQVVYTPSECPSGDIVIRMDGSTLPPQGDGTEITSWTETGTHGYTLIPWVAPDFGFPILGPRYDTTTADNILYSFYAVAPEDRVFRGMGLPALDSTDIGLSGAFTMTAVIITQANAPTGNQCIFSVQDTDDNEGWEFTLQDAGSGNNSLIYQTFSDISGGGAIVSDDVFDSTAVQKLLVTVMCDGVNVRMLINGVELVAAPFTNVWYANSPDGSETYSPPTINTDAVGSEGLYPQSFGNGFFYGQIPFFQINNTNLSDADRQAIESPQAALYGISYTTAPCSIGCGAS